MKFHNTVTLKLDAKLIAMHMTKLELGNCFLKVSFLVEETEVYCGLNMVLMNFLFVKTRFILLAQSEILCLSDYYTVSLLPEKLFH